MSTWVKQQTAIFRVIFKSDGKVGIGTASPLATLHVGSAAGSLQYICRTLYTN